MSASGRLTIYSCTSGHQPIAGAIPIEGDALENERETHNDVLICGDDTRTLQRVGIKVTGAVVVIGVKVQQLFRATHAQEIVVVQSQPGDGCQVEGGERCIIVGRSRPEFDAVPGLQEILARCGLRMNRGVGPHGEIASEGDGEGEQGYVWQLAKDRILRGLAAERILRGLTASAENILGQSSAVASGSLIERQLPAEQPEPVSESLGVEPLMEELRAIPPIDVQVGWLSRSSRADMLSPVGLLSLNGRMFSVVYAGHEGEDFEFRSKFDLIVAGKLKATGSVRLISERRLIMLRAPSCAELHVQAQMGAVINLGGLRKDCACSVKVAGGPSVILSGWRGRASLDNAKGLVRVLSRVTAQNQECSGVYDAVLRCLESAAWELLAATKPDADGIFTLDVFKRFSIPLEPAHRDLFCLLSSLNEPDGDPELAHIWPSQDGLEWCSAEDRARLERYLCPITGGLARDPVHPHAEGSAQANLIYEFESLWKWVSGQPEAGILPATCPVSRCPLAPVEQWRRIPSERQEVFQHLQWVAERLRQELREERGQPA